MLRWCTGSLVVSTASGRFSAKNRTAASKSSGVRASTGTTATPRPGATACNSSSKARLDSLFGFHRKATRPRFGTTSLRSCNRFGTRSGPNIVLPVILPPGVRKAFHQPDPYRIADRDRNNRHLVSRRLRRLCRRGTENRDQIDRDRGQVLCGGHKPIGL